VRSENSCPTSDDPAPTAQVRDPADDDDDDEEWAVDGDTTGNGQAADPAEG
jgi:hypothetical protein